MLFIHGGPGGIGVADFIQYQGERLLKSFKVIAPEQRGVWRFQPILDEEHISLEDIIEDFEELRKKLHINKWSLLSHSFGGYLAVLYANLYPNSIEYMIYECPSFDLALSERSMLKEAANELVELGNPILAEEYFKALKEITINICYYCFSIILLLSNPFFTRIAYNVPSAFILLIFSFRAFNFF